MSNFGIIISFIIGGLLLVSLLVLNGRVAENSGDVVFNMAAKTKVATINKVMRLDFMRIGYRYNKRNHHGKPAIRSFSDTSITFYAGLSDSYPGTGPAAHKITWTFTGKKLKSTPNPNDCKLIRRAQAGGKEVFDVACGSGKFGYAMGKSGNPVSITVSMQVEASEKYGNENNYQKSLYRRTFTPPDIKLKHLGNSYWGN